jgi:hypothetical protein
MVHACNPSILEAEAEGSRISGQPGLNNKTPTQKQKEKKRLAVTVCKLLINFIGKPNS